MIRCHDEKVRNVKMYRGVEGTLYEGEILRLAQRPVGVGGLVQRARSANLRVGLLQPGLWVAIRYCLWRADDVRGNVVPSELCESRKK